MRCLAIILCLLSYPASALELIFPAGTFTPAQTTFTAADQPVTIRCAGADQTTLILPDGLDITYDIEFAAPIIEGCSLVTQGQGGTALTITGPVLPTSTQHGPRLRDLSIRGEDVSINYWAKGVRLVDVWNPILRDINVKGLDQVQPPFTMTACMEFERSQVVSVEKFDCYHAEVGVKQLGGTYGEGFSLRDFNLVGVMRGVQLLGAAGYTISDGHINAYERCIDLQGKLQLNVDGLLCYKTHLSQLDFTGIQAIGSSLLKIVNTTIEGSTAVTEGGHTAGMVLIGVFHSQVIGNTCENFKLTYGCIIVGTGSHDNQLVNNQSRTGAGLVVKVNPDAGANNYVFGNKP